MHRVLRGEFRPGALQRYVAFKASVFWGLIGLAWLNYPAENRYSIWTHTFSFLGSFNEEHSPDRWWIFTAAMLFWSAAMLPLVPYIYRRFAPISVGGAGVGAALFYLGSVGIALVGLFPDVRDPLIGELRWTEVHEKAAVMIAIGFTLGILWHGLLLLADALRSRMRGAPAACAHRGLLWPYLAWSAVVFAAAYNQTSWALKYEAMRAAAKAAGQPIRSSWGESLGTIYAFPLWENIVIYALYAFLVWFVLALPPAPREARS